LADELEATENEVKTTMVDQKDKDLVALTSAAAWICGLEIASGVILGSDSLQGLEVIRQPDLAAKLASQLGSLPARLKGAPQVASTKQALESAATLLMANGTSKDDLRHNLQRIHEESAAAVKTILTSSTAVAATSPSPSPSPSAAPATNQPVTAPAVSNPVTTNAAAPNPK
jgi:hypothetical protein